MKYSRLNLTLQCVGYITNIILLIGLGMGLYTRWVYTQEIAVMLIAILGLFIFGVALALIYYFSMEVFGFCLARIWIGCLLGVIGFTEQSQFQEEIKEEVMNGLLVTSLVLRFFWAVAMRIARLVPQQALIVNEYECLEMIGMCVGAVATGRDFLSISLLVIGLFLTLTAVRLKSLMAVVNLICLAAVTGIFFFPRMLKFDVDTFALWCFAGRMSVEPLLDLHFLRLTCIERWRPLFEKSRFQQRLLIGTVVTVQLSFFSLSAKQMPQHKEWYVVVPIFVAFSIVWLCYHLVMFITSWQLSNKISECTTTYNSLSEGKRSMERIMASRGVRHFSLVSKRLVLVALVSTLILAAVGWETKSPLSLAMLSIVLPLEVAMLNLLWELGSVLGGTCIGYALVAPVTPFKPGESMMILPTNAMQELSGQATSILNTVQQFFSYHLIETFGCDFSSSGLTKESVQSKLKSFFQKETADGPRFDTYLVFYSGPVYHTGDWALAGNESLKFETIIEWWNEFNDDSGARLILVLDTQHSNLWIREVCRIQDNFVGIQTCLIKQAVTADEEECAEFDRNKAGHFTSDWMEYNSTNSSSIDWHEKNRPVIALYGISRSWADFTFHLPTDQDMEQHWTANFPGIIKPLIKVTNFPNLGGLLCCCDCLIKCFKRTRLLWFPPKELSTGHGFKLIRS